MAFVAMGLPSGFCGSGVDIPNPKVWEHPIVAEQGAIYRGEPKERQPELIEYKSKHRRQFRGSQRAHCSYKQCCVHRRQYAGCVDVTLSPDQVRDRNRRDCRELDWNCAPKKGFVADVKAWREFSPGVGVGQTFNLHARDCSAPYVLSQIYGAASGFAIADARVGAHEPTVRGVTSAPFLATMMAEKLELQRWTKKQDAWRASPLRVSKRFRRR